MTPAPDRPDKFSAGGWFDLSEPRNEAESRYLAVLRRVVQTRREFEGITPDLSSAFDNWVPLTVGLEVPKVTADRRYLWASYWVRGDGQQQLQGAWGDDHLLDDWTADLEDDLTVAGVDANPEEFADWTAAWFARQLSRPVYREEWSRRGRTRSGDSAIRKLCCRAGDLSSRPSESPSA